MAEKPKLLFITNDYPPNEGGMETCALELSENFKNYFDELIIITNSHKHNYNNCQIIKINISRNFIFKFLKLLFCFAKILLAHKPQYIYINTWSPNGLPIFLLTRIFKIPYFITAHGLDIVEPLKSKFHKFCMTIVLNNAKKIICVSHYTKELIEKYLTLKKKNNLFVINNGINLKKFKNENIDIAKKKIGAEKKFILLTVSRLTPRKGHLQVIDCIVELKKEINNILYLIVGRGPNEKTIAEKIEILNLQENVKLIGFINDSELLNYYNACDIFIMLSDEILETGDVEGFGVAYLEANACAKPAIAKNSGGARDAIKNGINGFLCENNKEVIEKIKYLYYNCDKKNEIGKTAQKYLIDNFDWQIIAKKYIQEIVK
ncbi:MAG TPA: glycosyltransferase family 4 protein [bacterium]|nr:glycosyltransferase family 4 protein [bacterium]